MVAIGVGAGQTMTTPERNVLVGGYAGQVINTGGQNIFNIEILSVMFYQGFLFCVLAFKTLFAVRTQPIINYYFTIYSK